MASKDLFDFDVSTLQGFVSDSILHFFSEDNTTPLTSESSTSSTYDDAELDALLLASSNTYENAKKPRLSSASKPTTLRAFAPTKSKEEVERARKCTIPKKTLDDMRYCVGIWNEWRYHREINDGVVIPAIDELDLPDLASFLSHFILEIRKKNGDEFPPNSLHHIVSGLQRHLRFNGKPAIDFFNDSIFADFRMNLDAEMKRLQRKGLGSHKRQAESLSIEEEELLWAKGLLGSATPQALVDTMLFMNGLYFALRSGDEHWQLRFDPCQIELIERTGQRPYLKYTEDISKNRPGGLKGRKTKPKIVTHHANKDNPDRCFVRLFKLYNSLCPPERPLGSFYLQPLTKPRPDCWFTTKPIGHHTLDRTVARLCQQAGIPGYQTNHSLHATTATRLYQAGVDEQLVIEHTGHQSLEGVRSYKRTSEIQKENLSDILNGGTNSSIASSHAEISLVVRPEIDSIPVSSHGHNEKHGGHVVNHTHCSSNTVAMKVIQPPSFNFHSCSVTINYTTQQ